MNVNGFPLLSGINEDHVYLCDVLGLEYGTSETQLNERLKDQAKALDVNLDLYLSHGVEVGTAHFDSQLTTGRNSPLMITTETPRRSISVDSQSTGLTSLESELSRGKGVVRSKWARARGVLTGRDYDTCHGRDMVEPRSSVSSTPPITPSTSLHSLPLTPTDTTFPKKNGSRRIKALTALKLMRSDFSPSRSTDQCSHCLSSDSTSSQHGKRAIHRLPCGHTLCTPAFRELIRSATAAAPGAPPMCCGQPISRRSIEHVLAQPEGTTGPVVRCNSHRSDSALSAPPMKVKQRPALPPLQQRPASDSDSSNNHVKQDDILPIDNSKPFLPKDLAWIGRNYSYSALHDEQVALLYRFNTWVCNRQSQLSNHHTNLLANLQQIHEATTTSLIDAHITATSEAEDKQVAAEAKLRVQQEQEKRDNATALQHMLAYCAGTYRSTGEAHGRVVTEQDRAELEKALRVRDAIDVRHSSAINVLRGEQGRRLKARLLRQEREVQDLIARQTAEIQGLNKDFESAVATFSEEIGARRRRVGERWEWRLRILAKEVEDEAGTSVGGLGTPLTVPSKDLFVYFC